MYVKVTVELPNILVQILLVQENGIQDYANPHNFFYYDSYISNLKRSQLLLALNLYFVGDSGGQ